MRKAHRNFNPRPSREGRHIQIVDLWAQEQFQSTPLAGGATLIDRPQRPLFRFQSTPLAGGATSGARIDVNGAKFQSTPLAGGATRAIRRRFWHGAFQSTPLAGGATAAVSIVTLSQLNFNPRPSREGRHGIPLVRGLPLSFQSTPLAGGATRTLHV